MPPTLGAVDSLGQLFGEVIWAASRDVPCAAGDLVGSVATTHLTGSPTTVHGGSDESVDHGVTVEVGVDPQTAELGFDLFDDKPFDPLQFVA